MENVLIYAISIGIALLVGGLSALVTNGSMGIYEEIITPPLAPPSWLFPVVWTILFALMGIGAARIYLAPPSKARSRGLNLFIAQLVVNFFWSPVFFNLQAFGLAFFWLLLLWGLVIWMILTFRKVDRTAANLQIPYLLWLTFAAYLNAGVWYLNM